MYSQLYFTLEQESHVIRSAIGTGLTQLRKANLHDRGAFYTAFFQLAIGFERMAKLGIVLDHLAHNSLNPPGQQVMKAYGHDLVALRSRLEKLSLHPSYSLSTTFTFSQFGQRILDFLSRFARGMRYANLNDLSSGSNSPTPFTEWEPILHDIVNAKVRRSVINSITARSSTLEAAIKDASVSICSDLGGRSLDISSSFKIPRLYDLAAPHMIWEMLLLLAPMRDFVVQACHLVNAVPRPPESRNNAPWMTEFFEFLGLERSLQMRRKKWPS